MKKDALKFFFTALLLITTVGSYAQDAIIGFWKTGNGNAIVEIYKTNNKYFGKIVWLAEPIDPNTGIAKVDSKNPNEALRTKPIIGLINLRNFDFIKTNLWENGKVYDPKNGKDYSCKITMIDANTIDVRGFIGFSMLGRTDTWKRQKTKNG